ncbi:MAG TPA: DUF2321 domain-containing protein [Rhizobiaceae bacterium]|nr:DUF2321 domain-containing protein [Rhizobiaceae bacterium]
MAYRYSNAQICNNGHLITSDIEDGSGANFCSNCGAATVVRCAHCSAGIRGDADDDGFTLSMGPVPAFCHYCGKPYEWTLRQVQAAKDLADEIEDMDEAEREKAKASFIDLASDTPQTAVAATRVKKLIAKAGPIIGNAIREIVVSIATDAAKKTIGL